MIFRKETKEIDGLFTLDIPHRAGIYLVYCPLTKYLKFGRAIDIAGRIKGYRSMCMNGGGVVIYYKELPQTMIKVAEKVLQSVAATKLRCVDRDEYFVCATEEYALELLKYSLSYLTRYYTTVYDMLQPVVDAATEDEFLDLRELLCEIQSKLLSVKFDEHLSIKKDYEISLDNPT